MIIGRFIDEFITSRALIACCVWGSCRWNNKYGIVQIRDCLDLENVFHLVIFFINDAIFICQFYWRKIHILKWINEMATRAFYAIVYEAIQVTFENFSKLS